MQLKKGINLGGFLSQCVHNYTHYKSFIQEDDIKKISSMGFDHVRLPIDYEVFQTEDGAFIKEGFLLVDDIINLCIKYKLDIILDLHKAYGYDFNDAFKNENNNLFNSEELQVRFINLWKNIASSYAKYNNVAFELLNEVVEDNNASAWNKLIDKTVKAIRAITKESIIIYGGIRWNSATTVKYLNKPLDKNIIFTFHFYEPIIFTHQKAYWMDSLKNIESVKYPQTMDYYKELAKITKQQTETITNSKLEGNLDKRFLKDIILEAIEKAKELDVRLYCGEFGVIDQAPINDTLNWLNDTISLFNEYNIGYALWTYKKMDFGIIGPHYEPIYEDAIRILTK